MIRNLNSCLVVVLALIAQPYAKADISVDTSKTVAASGGDYTLINENVTINNGGKLTFNNASFGQSQAITVTVNQGGTLELYSTVGNAGNVHDGANLHLANGAFGITLTGDGDIIKSGAGTYVNTLGAFSNSPQSPIVQISLSDKSTIRINEGTWIYGGQFANLNSNKASLYIAPGASINIWDTTNSLRVNALTGEGRIWTTTQYTPAPIVVGNGNGSGTFAGTLDNNAAHTALTCQVDLTKVGTGVQTMTGANTYAGETLVQGGVLAFADGVLSNGAATSGTIGSGPVGVSNGATLEFISSANNTIVGVLSGAGKIQQKKEGSTLTLANTGNSFTGQIQVESGSVVAHSLGANAIVDLQAQGASFEYNSAEGSTGSICLSGTGTFVKSGAGALNVAASDQYQGTTKLAGGTVSFSGSYMGAQTLVQEDTTVTLSGPTPWLTQYYKDTTTNHDNSTGRTEQNTNSTPWALESRTPNSVLSTWTTNSGLDTKNRILLLDNYSTLTYQTDIFVNKDITVDLASRFDDAVAIFTRSINADGSYGEWQTLLNFPENGCQKVTGTVSLGQGQYQMVISMADFGGSTGPYTDTGSNVYGPNGTTAIGAGIRLTGSTELVDSSYNQFIIDSETGDLALGDGSITTVKTNPVIQGPISIDAGKTLTVDNPSVGIQSLTISKPVAGTGTLKLTNSSNSAKPLTINLPGGTAGSLEADANILLNLQGNVGGNFVLNSAQVILDTIVENGTAVARQIGGDVTITGGKIFVDLTGITSDSVLNQVLGSVTIDPETEIIFSTEDLVIPATEITLFATEDGLSLSAAEFERMLTASGALRFAGVSTDGGLKLTIGDGASVPEPTTQLLLIFGLIGLAFLNRRSLAISFDGSVANRR